MLVDKVRMKHELVETLAHIYKPPKNPLSLIEEMSDLGIDIFQLLSLLCTSRLIKEDQDTVYTVQLESSEKSHVARTLALSSIYPKKLLYLGFAFNNFTDDWELHSWLYDLNDQAVYEHGYLRTLYYGAPITKRDMELLLNRIK